MAALHIVRCVIISIYLADTAETKKKTDDVERGKRNYYSPLLYHYISLPKGVVFSFLFFFLPWGVVM